MPKQAVKVCIRTRPTGNFDETAVQIDVNKASVIIDTSAKKKADSHIPDSAVDNSNSIFSFNYHHILHNASQDTVYNTLSRDVVQSVVNGTNGTIMCYGQTGSGKTVRRRESGLQRAVCSHHVGGNTHSAYMNRMFYRRRVVTATCRLANSGVPIIVS